MPKRRHIRVSEAQDGRSERPAMGYGEPEAGLGAARASHANSGRRFPARDEVEDRGAEVGEAFLADALHAQQRRR
jgi:hypothetical protein